MQNGVDTHFCKDFETEDPNKVLRVWPVSMFYEPLEGKPVGIVIRVVERKPNEHFLEDSEPGYLGFPAGRFYLFNFERREFHAANLFRSSRALTMVGLDIEAEFDSWVKNARENFLQFKSLPKWGGFYSELQGVMNILQSIGHSR